VKALPTAKTQAIEELVHRHQGALRGFLLFMGCPPRLLDDLLQDVFLSFLSADFDYRSDAATAAYLRSIARNLFLKALRRERRGPPVLDLDAAERAWVEFQGDDQGSRYVAALRECLRAVSQKAKEVLRLRYESALAREAIGARLGLSESGVKSILVRTRQRLRLCVERRLA
jgi:RNA polymerase sigma-70 factor (ECF subfamily)